MGRMKIAIIGAGATGLAAAWDFAKQSHQVTVYEGSDRVGGLAAGFKDEAWDWTLEKFYHHWFASDNDIFELAEEMGALDRIVFPRPKTSYWMNGAPVRSEMSLSALMLPLSLASTVRMALAGMYLKLTPRWREFERVTADQWMRRWMGSEAYEKFFLPLLIGKFAEAYDQVPMSFMWARIVKRSLKLGTYIGGFQAFVDDLARQLRAQDVKMQLNARVERITARAHARLRYLRGRDGGARDEAFLVYRTMAEPRVNDMKLDHNDSPPESMWGEPKGIN